MCLVLLHLMDDKLLLSTVIVGKNGVESHKKVMIAIKKYLIWIEGLLLECRHINNFTAFALLSKRSFR